MTTTATTTWSTIFHLSSSDLNPTDPIYHMFIYTYIWFFIIIKILSFLQIYKHFYIHLFLDDLEFKKYLIDTQTYTINATDK